MDLGYTQRDLAILAVNLTRAAVILIVAVVVARLIRAWILRLGARNRLAINVAALLANLAQLAIVVFGLVLILPTFGVDWTGLLTVVGTIGLAISLAFQDLLRNFIAGIYLLIERPFQIGDVIAIGPEGKVTGTVQAIALRTTSLRTVDGLQVIVPNNAIFSDVVTNRSAVNLRRHLIGVSIPPGEGSLSELSTRITDALHSVPGVAGTPAPSTEVSHISDQTLKLQVEFWTPPAGGEAVSSAVILALRGALPAADVDVMS